MRKRALGLALAIIVGAVLVSVSGAATTKTQRVTRIDVSTRAAVIHYLRSIHVKAEGAVIERGALNYAGAGCPGGAWKCARTRHTVVQIATPGGRNSFACKSARCVVVQIAGVRHGVYVTARNLASAVAPNKGGGGGNSAVCIKTSGLTQSCSISQTGANGNTAGIYEDAGKTSGLTQTASYTAQVTQSASSGDNRACVHQVITMDASTNLSGGKAKPIAVGLQANQSIVIRQDSPMGHNYASQDALSNGSCASGRLNQAQSLTSVAGGSGASSVTQNEDQNSAGDSPNMTLDIEQNQGVGHGTSTSTGNDAIFTQSENVVATAFLKSGSVTQTQSSPNGGILAKVNQDANAKSTADALQNETQCEDAYAQTTFPTAGCSTTEHTAPAGLTLNQTQYGPVKKTPGDSSQTGNTNCSGTSCDSFTVTQNSRQDSDTGSTQTNTVSGGYTTTGNGSVTQNTTENGTTTTTTQTGQDVSSTTNCTGSTCTPSAPPAPIIDSGPPQPISASPDATFTFHDADTSATFLCDIGDGNGFSACTSPNTYGNLADGSHTFSVEARDNGVTSTATTYTWTVDTNVIVGNNAAFGGGAIQTYDLGTGALINSFVPDGASGANGRALAIQGDEVFYSELSNGNNTFFGPSDGIHVAPWNGGAGGPDSRVLPNPDPTTGIQDLTFSNGNLYALTGYDTGTLQAWELNPSNGAVIAGPIAIAGGDPGADGFAVLPDGNFLINGGDASCTYTEYNSTTGQPTGQSITVGPEGTTCTGVETDGSSLYFETNFDSFTKTDLSGNVIATTSVNSNEVEDVSLVASAQVIG